MNVRLIQIICLLLILSSCKSVQHITSRGKASNKTTAHKKRVEFLDGVKINPGENKSHAGYDKRIKLIKPNVNTNTSFNIETADWLQIKYAIMLDVPVEDLNNLPLIKQIDHWWGTRYCMGGENENCIDCSAFTQTLLRIVYGIDVPRTAAGQYNFSTRIEDTDLHEGDLVFFKSGRAISHVGLYVGNYKFVHAASSSGVIISDLNDLYWGRRYFRAGRVSASQVKLSR